MKLEDPQVCRHCGARGRVINSRLKKEKGYRWRLRKCATCTVPSKRDRTRFVAHTWSTWETKIDPRRLTEQPKKPIIITTS